MAKKKDQYVQTGTIQTGTTLNRQEVIANPTAQVAPYVYTPSEEERKKLAAQPQKPINPLSAIPGAENDVPKWDEYKQNYDKSLNISGDLRKDLYSVGISDALAQEEQYKNIILKAERKARTKKLGEVDDVSLDEAINEVNYDIDKYNAGVAPELQRQKVFTIPDDKDADPVYNKLFTSANRRYGNAVGLHSLKQRWGIDKKNIRDENKQGKLAAQPVQQSPILPPIAAPKAQGSQQKTQAQVSQAPGQKLDISTTGKPYVIDTAEQIKTAGEQEQQREVLKQRQIEQYGAKTAMPVSINQKDKSIEIGNILQAEKDLSNEFITKYADALMADAKTRGDKTMTTEIAKRIANDLNRHTADYDEDDGIVDYLWDVMSKGQWRAPIITGVLGGLGLDVDDDYLHAGGTEATRALYEHYRDKAHTLKQLRGAVTAYGQKIPMSVFEKTENPLASSNVDELMYGILKGGAGLLGAEAKQMVERAQAAGLRTQQKYAGTPLQGYDKDKANVLGGVGQGSTPSLSELRGIITGSVNKDVAVNLTQQGFNTPSIANEAMGIVGNLVGSLYSPGGALKVSSAAIGKADQLLRTSKVLQETINKVPEVASVAKVLAGSRPVQEALHTAGTFVLSHALEKAPNATAEELAQSAASGLLFGGISAVAGETAMAIASRNATYQKLLQKDWFRKALDEASGSTAEKSASAILEQRLAAQKDMMYAVGGIFANPVQSAINNTMQGQEYSAGMFIADMLIGPAMALKLRAHRKKNGGEVPLDAAYWISHANAIELSTDAVNHKRYAETESKTEAAKENDATSSSRRQEQDIDPDLQNVDYVSEEAYDANDPRAADDAFQRRTDEEELADLMDQVYEDIAPQQKASSVTAESRPSLAAEQPTTYETRETTTFGARRSEIKDFEGQMNELQTFVHNIVKERVTDTPVVYHNGKTLFNADDNTIYINNALKGTAEETNALLHEATHAVYHKAINTDPEFAKELEALHRKVINSRFFKKWADSGNATEAAYMAGDLHEFFVGFVDNVNGIGDIIVNNAKSTGSRMKDVAMRVFGASDIDATTALNQFRSLAESIQKTPTAVETQEGAVPQQTKFESETDVPEYVNRYINQTLEPTPENQQFAINYAAEIEKEFQGRYKEEQAKTGDGPAIPNIDENTPLGTKFSLYRDVASLLKIKDLKTPDERKAMTPGITRFIKSIERLGITDEIALAHFTNTVLADHPEYSNLPPQELNVKLAEFAEKLETQSEPELLKILRESSRMSLTKAQELLSTDPESHERFLAEPFNKTAAATLVGAERVSDLDKVLRSMLNEPDKLVEYLTDNAVKYASARTEDQKLIDAAQEKARVFANDYILNNGNVDRVTPLVIASDPSGDPAKPATVYIADGSDLTHDQSSGQRLIREIQKPTALYNGLARLGKDIMFPDGNALGPSYQHMTMAHKEVLDILLEGRVGIVTNSDGLKRSKPIKNAETAGNHVLNYGRFLFPKGWEGNIFFELPRLRAMVYDKNVVAQEAKVNKVVKLMEEMDLTHFLSSDNLWGMNAAKEVQRGLETFDLWKLVERAKEGRFIEQDELIAEMLKDDLAGDKGKEWRRKNLTRKEEIVQTGNELIRRLMERFKESELGLKAQTLHDNSSLKPGEKLAEALNVFYNKLVDHANSNEVIAHPVTGKRGKHAMKYAGVQTGFAYRRFKDAATMQTILKSSGAYSHPLIPESAEVPNSSVEEIQAYWRTRGIHVGPDKQPSIKQYVLTDAWAEANPQIWAALSGQGMDGKIEVPSKFHDGASWIINKGTHEFLSRVNNANPDEVGNIKYAFGGDHIYKSEYTPLYETGNAVVDDFLQILKDNGIATIATQSTIKSKAHTYNNTWNADKQEKVIYDHDGTLVAVADQSGNVRKVSKEDMIARYASAAISPEHIRSYDLAGDNALQCVSLTRVNDTFHDVSFGLDLTPYTSFGAEPALNKAMSTLMHNKATDWGHTFRAFNNIFGGAKLNKQGLVDDKHTVRFVEKLLDKVKRTEDIADFFGDQDTQTRIARHIENALTDGKQVDVAALRALDTIYPGILTKTVGNKQTLAFQIMKDAYDSGLKSETFGKQYRLAPYVPKANHLSNAEAHAEKWMRVELAEKAQWMNEKNIAGSKVDVDAYVEENIASAMEAYRNDKLTAVAKTHYVNGVMHHESNGTIIAMKDLDAANERIRKLRAQGKDIDYIYAGSLLINKLNPSDAITSWSPSMVIGVDTEMNTGMMMNQRFVIKELGRDHDGDAMTVLYPHDDWERDPADDSDNPALMEYISPYRQTSGNTSGRPGSNFAAVHEALVRAKADKRDNYKIAADENVSKGTGFKTLDPTKPIEKTVMRTDSRTTTPKGYEKSMDASAMYDENMANGINLLNSWYRFARDRKLEPNKEYKMVAGPYEFVIKNDPELLKTNDAYYKQAQYDRYNYMPYDPKHVFFKSRVAKIGLNEKYLKKLQFIGTPLARDPHWQAVNGYIKNNDLSPLTIDEFEKTLTNYVPKFDAGSMLLMATGAEKNRGVGYGQSATMRADMIDASNAETDNTVRKPAIAQNTNPTGKVQLPKTKRNPKYLAKDQAKANMATHFIGYGAPGTSTAAYAKAYLDQGLSNRVNQFVYTKDDVVFVSVNGGNKPVDMRTSIHLNQALRNHATIVTDNLADRERAYNSGEREIQKQLLDYGYVEEGTSGVWKPGPDAKYELSTGKENSKKSAQNAVINAISSISPTLHKKIFDSETVLLNAEEKQNVLNKFYSVDEAMEAFENGNNYHANFDPYARLQRNTSLWTANDLNDKVTQAQLHDYLSNARATSVETVPVVNGYTWDLDNNGIFLDTPSGKVAAAEIVQASGWHQEVRNLIEAGVPLGKILPPEIMGRVQAIDILKAKDNAHINQQNLAQRLRENPDMVVIRTSSMMFPNEEWAVKQNMVSYNPSTKTFDPYPEYQNLRVINRNDKTNDQIRQEITRAVLSAVDQGKTVVIDRGTLGGPSSPLFLPQRLLNKGASVIPNRTFTDTRRTKLRGKITGFVEPQMAYTEVLQREPSMQYFYHQGLKDAGANTYTPDNIDVLDELMYRVGEVQEIDAQQPWSDEAGKPIEQREPHVFGLFDGKLKKIDGLALGDGKAGAINRLNRYIGKPIHTLTHEECKNISDAFEKWARNEFAGAANPEAIVEQILQRVNPTALEKFEMPQWAKYERQIGPDAAKAAKYSYFFSLVSEAYKMQDAQNRTSFKDFMAQWSPLSGQSTMDMVDYFANDKMLFSGQTETHSIVNVSFDKGQAIVEHQPVRLVDTRNLVTEPGRPDVKLTSATRVRHSHVFQHLNKLKDSISSTVSSWRTDTAKLFPDGTPFTQQAQEGAMGLLSGDGNPFFKMVNIPVEYVPDPNGGPDLVPVGGGETMVPAQRDWQDEWSAKFVNDAMPMVGVRIVDKNGTAHPFYTTPENNGLFSPESLNGMVRLMMPDESYNLPPGVTRNDIESALKWSLTAKAYNMQIATYQRSYAEALKNYGRNLARNNYINDIDPQVTQLHNDQIDEALRDVQFQIETFANEMIKESDARALSSVHDNMNSMSYVNYDEYAIKLKDYTASYAEAKEAYRVATKKSKGKLPVAGDELAEMESAVDNYNYYVDELFDLAARLNLTKELFGTDLNEAGLDKEKIADYTAYWLKRRMNEANRMNKQLSRSQAFFEREINPDTKEKTVGLFDIRDGKVLQHLFKEQPNYSPDLIFRRNKETVDAITNKATSIFQNAYTTEKGMRKAMNKPYLESGIAEDNFLADVSNESTIYQNKVDIHSPKGLRTTLANVQLEEGRRYLMPDEIGVPLSTPIAVTFRSSDNSERRTMTGRLAGVVRLPNKLVLTGKLRTEMDGVTKELENLRGMGVAENDPRYLQAKNRYDDVMSFQNTNDSEQGLKDFVVMYNQQAGTLNYIDAATITNAVTGHEHGYTGRIKQTNRSKRIAQAFNGADKLGEYLSSDMMVQTIKRLGYDQTTGNSYVAASESLQDQTTKQGISTKNIGFFAKVGREDVPTGYARLIDNIATVTNFSSSWMHGYGKETAAVIASVPLLPFMPVAAANMATAAIAGALFRYGRNWASNAKGHATRLSGVSNLYNTSDIARQFSTQADKPDLGSAVASVAARRIDRGVGLDPQIRAAEREARDENSNTLKLHRQYNDLMSIKKHYDGLGRVMTDEDLAVITGMIEKNVHLHNKVVASIRDGQLSLALYGEAPDGVGPTGDGTAYLRNLSDLMEANLDGINSVLVGASTFGKMSFAVGPEAGVSSYVNPALNVARLNNLRLRGYGSQGAGEETSVRNTATGANIIYDRLQAGTVAASNDMLRSSFATAMIDLVNGKFDQRALHLRSPLGRAISLFSQYSQNYNRRTLLGPKVEQEYWQAFFNGIAEDAEFRDALVNKYGVKVAGELVPTIWLGTERIETPYTKFGEDNMPITGNKVTNLVGAGMNPFSKKQGAYARNTSMGLAKQGLYFLAIALSGITGEKGKSLIEDVLDQTGGAMSSIASVIGGMIEMIGSSGLYYAGEIDKKKQSSNLKDGYQTVVRGLPGGMGMAPIRESLNLFGLYMMHLLGILPVYKEPDPMRSIQNASGAIGVGISGPIGLIKQAETAKKNAERDGLMHTGYFKTGGKKKRRRKQ